MKYIADHDLHIHSVLSKCAGGDEEQNKNNILEYARVCGFRTVCITDHYWDKSVPGASEWYKGQNFEHISQIKPLPQDDDIAFLFGCEAEMDRHHTLSIPESRYDDFDFIIVPTTHMHMKNGFVVWGNEDAAERARLWIKRFDALLDANLPFEKVGVAHLTCPLIYSGENKNGYLEVLKLIPESEYRRLFKRAAQCGLGIELNFNALELDDEAAQTVLLPYRIAKEERCKFYLGSDSHHPQNFVNAKKNFESIIDRLDLRESDKFTVKINR